MNRSLVRSTLLGTGLGLAWGAGWRGWMAVLAGDASSFTLARILMAALLAATIAGAFLGGAEPRQGATTPSGAYLLITFVVFSGLLAAACAIPHLPAPRELVART
jgi:hypothetical protein